MGTATARGAGGEDACAIVSGGRGQCWGDSWGTERLQTRGRADSSGSPVAGSRAHSQSEATRFEEVSLAESYPTDEP
jgi:hypothetical protein